MRMENYTDFNKIINEAREKLNKSKGIIILEHMNPGKRKAFHKLIDNKENIDSFSIGYMSTRRIVLKYISNEQIDINKMMEDANNLYNEKNYKEAIECYKKIICSSSDNNPYVYARIGLSYLKLKQKGLALSYLIVSNELNKSLGKNYNFDAIISSLMGEEEKHSPKIEEDIFDEKEPSNIDNLDEILDKIINKKYNIEEVQKEYGLSINDLNIVKLSLAKEYYKKALYTNGDKFVKEVEKQKDKSKEVKRFIDEIKKNKLFYKNRT